MWRSKYLRAGTSTLSQHIAYTAKLLEDLTAIAPAAASYSVSDSAPAGVSSSAGSSPNGNEKFVPEKFFMNGAAGTLDDRCPNAGKIFTWATTQRETDTALTLRARLIIAALEEDLMSKEGIEEAATILAEKKKAKEAQNQRQQHDGSGEDHSEEGSNSSTSISLEPFTLAQGRASRMWADLIKGSVWASSEASSVLYYEEHLDKRVELSLTGGIVGRSKRTMRSDGAGILELLELYEALWSLTHSNGGGGVSPPISDDSAPAAKGRSSPHHHRALTGSAAAILVRERLLSSASEAHRYTAVLEDPFAFMDRVVGVFKYVEATICPKIMKKIVATMLRLGSLSVSYISSSSSSSSSLPPPPPQVIRTVVAICNAAAEAKALLHHRVTVVDEPMLMGRGGLEAVATPSERVVRVLEAHLAKVAEDFSNPYFTGLGSGIGYGTRSEIKMASSDVANAKKVALEGKYDQIEFGSDAASSSSISSSSVPFLPVPATSIVESPICSIFDDFRSALHNSELVHSSRRGEGCCPDRSDDNVGALEFSSLRFVSPTVLLEDALELSSLSLEVLRTHWRLQQLKDEPSQGKVEETSTSTFHHESTDALSSFGLTGAASTEGDAASHGTIEGGSTGGPSSPTTPLLCESEQMKQSVVSTLQSALIIGNAIGRAGYYGYASSSTSSTKMVASSSSSDARKTSTPFPINLPAMTTPPSGLRRLCRLVTAVGRDAVRYAEEQHSNAVAKLEELNNKLDGSNPSSADLSYFTDVSIGGGGNAEHIKKAREAEKVTLSTLIEEHGSHLHMVRTATASALCLFSTPTAVCAVLKELRSSSANSAHEDGHNNGDGERSSAAATTSKPIYQAIADDTVADFIALATEWGVIHEPGVVGSIVHLQQTLLIVSGDIRLEPRGDTFGGISDVAAMSALLDDAGGSGSGGFGGLTHFAGLTICPTDSANTFVSPLIVRGQKSGLVEARNVASSSHAAPSAGGGVVVAPQRLHVLTDRILGLIRGVAEGRPRVGGSEELSDAYRFAFQEAHRHSVECLTLMGSLTEAYLMLVTHKHHGLSITKEVIRPLLYVLADLGDCRALNLIDLTTLYCVNKVDVYCIGALFRMCEAASDHHRARSLLMVMRDVVPGILSKVPPFVIRSLRNLQVLPKREGHLFLTPREINASDLGGVPSIGGAAGQK